MIDQQRRHTPRQLNVRLRDDITRHLLLPASRKREHLVDSFRRQTSWLKAYGANPSQALLFAGSADLPIDSHCDAGVTRCSRNADDARTHGVRDERRPCRPAAAILLCCANVADRAALAPSAERVTIAAVLG